MDLLLKYKKPAVIEFELALTHTYNDHLRASESKGVKGRKRNLHKVGKKGGLIGFAIENTSWYLSYNNFMKQCKLHIPEPYVWLIEDNTPLHSKAAQVCKDRGTGNKES